MVTIKDVAKLAGVSVSTVSNIINGKGSVGTEKYKRVKSAIAELNYHPSFIAQNLRNTNSHLIGVVLPYIHDPYDSMFTGISENLSRHGYYPIIRLTNSSPATEDEAIRQLCGLGVAGIILSTCSPAATDSIEIIKAQKIPLVLLSRDIAYSDCPKVFFNTRSLVYDRISSILNRNPQTRILLIRYQENINTETDCEQGFEQAYSHSETKHAVLQVELQSASYFDHIHAYLQNHNAQIDQILTTDMRLAQAAADAADLVGKNYPIHLPTHDNWQISRKYANFQPIEWNTELAGMQSADLLLEQIQSSSVENRTITVKPKLLRIDVAPFSLVPSDALHILAIDSAATEVMERLSSVTGREVGVNVQFDKLSPDKLSRAVEQELLSGGTEHDLFMIDLPWIHHLVNQDLLYDISDKISAELVSSYPESIQRTFLNNLNHRNVVPIIAGIQTVYYRRDIFENPDFQAEFFQNYGVHLGKPHTWKEFNYICQYFTKSHNPNSPFEYGTAMNVSYDIDLAHQYLSRQWAFHGHFTDEWGYPTLNDDANYRTMESLRTTHQYSYHTFDRNDTFNLDDDIFGLLLDGQIPIICGFANHYAPEKHRSRLPGIEQKIAVCEAPSRSSILSGWALGVNRNSSRVPACVAYLKWLMTDRIALSNMRLGGCMPTLAVHSNTDLRRKYPWLNLIAKTFSEGHIRKIITDRYGNLIEPVHLDYIIASALRESFTSQRSSRDILSDAQGRLASLLGYE